MCPMYSTDRGVMASELERLAEDGGPGAGWHLGWGSASAGANAEHASYIRHTSISSYAPSFKSLTFPYPPSSASKTKKTPASAHD